MMHVLNQEACHEDRSHEDGEDQAEPDHPPEHLGNSTLRST